MKEELLHFLWWQKRLPHHQFISTDGHAIEIIHFGNYNNSSGPDFSLGKIRYKNITWIGSIEMHLRSSDWLQHGHQNDEAYNNVILHVVWKHDKEIEINGEIVPCLELSKFVDLETVLNYEKLIHTTFEIPCFQYELKDFHQSFVWMRDRLIIERLSRKTDTYISNKNTKNVFFELLCMAFGGKTNKEAFRTLASRVDYKLLLRWKNEPEKKTAYLLGLSNLFSNELNHTTYGSIFRRLQYQYQLQSMEKVEWKTGAVRPQNHPKKRILELAQLLTENDFTFLSGESNPLIYKEKSLEWIKLLKENNRLSAHLQQAILVNTLIPFAFHKGKQQNESTWIEMSIDWLYEIKAEQNHIVKKYTSRGIDAQSAADTQALLEWHHAYCSEKKCLSCTVGQKLMNTCA